MDEITISVRFLTDIRQFEITSSAQPSDSVRIDSASFLNFDKSLADSIGRLIQAFALANLQSAEPEMRATAAAALKRIKEEKLLDGEDNVAQGIRQVIVGRMVRMATTNDHPYSLSDFPKLFHVALLFGNSDVAKLQKRWPRIRRQLAALSRESDPDKRKVLSQRFDSALTGG